jgi:LuxR family transcriptional regulator, maltose regulon positive regulatory protein
VNPESSDAVNRLRAVLQGYRGDFLESENAGDWHLELRDHLRRLWVDGLLALGAHLMEADCFEEAVGVYRTVVGADELNEGAHRQLMAALARSGQRGEALRHYDRFVALLRDDMGVTPERQTTVLYDRLRKAEAV